MPNIDITMDFKDGDWRDLKAEHSGHGFIERAAVLPKGMASGRPSVALAIRLDDGSVVLAETSYALFRMVQTAFKNSRTVLADMEQHPYEYI